MMHSAEYNRKSLESQIQNSKDEGAPEVKKKCHMFVEKNSYHEISHNKANWSSSDGI